ncbi:unnamed protein product [Ceutorhynchus assimilis]|uniref:C-type lectin domain-containing protein n=1 Tax=Ceutorhynchus assimilis TaxID=467358 RepID=A0A9N9QNT5_9CUCU|nr:unnamed protein product [Ceutorhynchus assimilis]
MYKISLLVIFWFGTSHCEQLDTKYHISTDSQNWFQALINCKSAGLELASIPSEKEEANLEKFIKQNGYNLSDGYWISGTNLGNGDFYWASTGNPIIYTKWYPGQPDNSKTEETLFRDENCIQFGMRKSTDENLEPGWNDLFCKFKLRYICQEIDNCL